MSALGDLLDDQAGELEGTERRPVDGGVEYVRVGSLFVVLGSEAEFRLGADIAAAALRTPDTHPSSRGPEWVAFGPMTMDRFARDRAAAWFKLAWGAAAR